MRQGDIIESIPDTEAEKISRTSRYLIITHCCDLAHLNEPVELLPCHPIEVLDGNYTRGKNSRVLHFEINGQCYEVRACEKAQITRKQLGESIVSHTANGEEQRILRYWLASRYARQALDDDTYLLIQKLPLKKLAKKIGKELEGIWAELGPCEDQEDGTVSKERVYGLYFVFTCDCRQYCGEIEERIALAMKKMFPSYGNVITHCVNIDQFYYREATTYTYVNFDYLSAE